MKRSGAIITSSICLCLLICFFFAFYKKDDPENCIVDPSVFESLDDGISIDIEEKSITEKGTVNGRDYSFTIDLSDWKNNTSPEQIGELSRLFWQVYPSLYERFGTISNAPADVVLIIENSGYEIAEAWDNNIHLHDMWLCDDPEDYDCITHELAHIIQNEWDGEKLEYDSYIERFADYCRFVYCLDDGSYNDRSWTLQTVSDEPDRETSVRFLVWLDYFISDNERDFMKDYFKICTQGEYYYYEWNDAWKKLFDKTVFDGMTIDEVWAEYASSDFASLSSHSENGEISDLLSEYDVRTKIKSK